MSSSWAGTGEGLDVGPKRILPFLLSETKPILFQWLPASLAIALSLSTILAFFL